MSFSQVVAVCASHVHVHSIESASKSVMCAHVLSIVIDAATYSTYVSVQD